MNKLCIEKLEEILISLSKFDGSYRMVDNTPSVPLQKGDYRRTNDQPVTINNNNYYDQSIHSYNSSNPFFYFWPIYERPSQTVIINNYENDYNKKKKKKEEKEEDNSLMVAASVAGVVAVALGGTYIVSKDEYVTYYMSRIDMQIKDLIGTYSGTCFEEKFGELELVYSRWKDSYTSRTKKVFASKGALVTSGILGFSGLYFGPTLVLGGICGATVSGCYWIWMYMTSDKDIESLRYYMLVSYVKNLTDEMKIPQNLMDIQEPSAPLNDTTEPLPPYNPSGAIQGVYDDGYNPIYPDFYNYH